MRGYLDPSHRQWATFFDHARLRCHYLPQNFGVSVDMAFKPHFRVEDYWFHVENGPPSAETILGLYYVARTTQLDCVIAVSRLFVPCISMEPRSPMLLVIAPSGARVTRYWGQKTGPIELVTGANPHHLFSPTLAQAFMSAFDAAIDVPPVTPET